MTVQETLRQSVVDGMLAPCDVFTPARGAPDLPAPSVPRRASLGMAGDRRDSFAVPADRLAGGSGPEVEIDARARPYSHAGLAAAELAPGRSRPEHQDAPSATPAGRRVNGDSQAQPGIAPADARDKLAVVAFTYRERSGMTTGGSGRARRLLDDFAWGTRTVGSRSSQWAAYVEFFKQERRALVPVSESQLLFYVRWLAKECKGGRRSVSAKSLPQYLSAVRVVSRAILNPDMPSEDRSMSMPILQALIRVYAQWEAQSFPQLTHRGGVPADVIQAVWGNGMQIALPDVIRDSAAVVTAYVLGLRESSVMSLPTENVTITEDRTTVHLVFGERQTVDVRVPTYT
jgi:hypothetical protein